MGSSCRLSVVSCVTFAATITCAVASTAACALLKLRNALQWVKLGQIMG
jgi:hypothetical protein